MSHRSRVLAMFRKVVSYNADGPEFDITASRSGADADASICVGQVNVPAPDVSKESEADLTSPPKSSQSLLGLPSNSPSWAPSPHSGRAQKRSVTLPAAQGPTDFPSSSSAATPPRGRLPERSATEPLSPVPGTLQTSFSFASDAPAEGPSSRLSLKSGGSNAQPMHASSLLFLKVKDMASNAAHAIREVVHEAPPVDDEGKVRISWFQEQQMSYSRMLCLHVVQSQRFEYLMGIIVLLNCLSLGIESELEQEETCEDNEIRLAQPSCETQSAFFYLDHAFLLFFSVELSLRTYAFGRFAFMSLGGMFDASIVLLGWITEVLVPLILIAASPDLSILNALKMLRVLRAIRVLRMAKMFKSLWFVVESFFGCMKALMWIMTFIMVIIFLFAILCVTFIGRNDTFNDVTNEDDVPIQPRFRTTVRTMVTLFQIMTLDEWWNILNPLFERASWTVLFFFAYIVVSALALMNLVTAVVVDTSVRKTREQNAQEIESQMWEQRVNWMVEDIREVFAKFDADGSGYLDMEEFTDSAMEVPFIANLCTSMRMESTEDLEDLFKIMAGDDYVLAMDDFVEAVTKFNKAAGDRTMVASIRTARSREARMELIKQIVMKSPEMLSQLGEVCDSFKAASERMSSLDGKLLSFQEEMEEQSKTISDKLKEISSHLDASMDLGGPSRTEAIGHSSHQQGDIRDTVNTVSSSTRSLLTLDYKSAPQNKKVVKLASVRSQQSAQPEPAPKATPTFKKKGTEAREKPRKSMLPRFMTREKLEE